MQEPGMGCNEGVQKEHVNMTMAQRDVLEFWWCPPSGRMHERKRRARRASCEALCAPFDGAHQGILEYSPRVGRDASAIAVQAVTAEVRVGSLDNFET